MRDGAECVGDRGGGAREVPHHLRQLEYRSRIAQQIRRCGERADVAVFIGHCRADHFVVNFVEHGANRHERKSARGRFCCNRGGFHVDRDRAGNFLGASLFGAGGEHAMRCQNRASRVGNTSASERTADRAQMRLVHHRHLFVDAAVGIEGQNPFRQNEVARPQSARECADDTGADHQFCPWHQIERAMRGFGCAAMADSVTDDGKLLAGDLRAKALQATERERSAIAEAALEGRDLARESVKENYQPRDPDLTFRSARTRLSEPCDISKIRLVSFTNPGAAA